MREQTRKRVVITGAAGFIYSHVARHFLRQGYGVTIADHFDAQGKGRNIASIIKDVKLLIGDLVYGDLAKQCAAVEADYVIHAAAFTHVDDAIADPVRFALNNVVGTTMLLQALVKHAHRPEKVIIVSTDEVYGSTPAGQVFDEQARYNPTNAYSASKVGVEAMANAFWNTHKLPVVIVRPCNTYSIMQFPSKAIPRFVGQMIRREPVTIYNDGQGSRDWLHATDHARAIETLCLAGVPGEAYNLAAGEEHTDLDIATRIIEILSGQPVGIDPSALPLTYVPGRPGHDRRYAMDGSKLRALGWQPRVPFDEGLRETVLWNAAHQDHWQHDLVEVE